MNALGFFLTVAFCAMVLVLPRRGARIAYLASVFFITQGQSVDLLGFNTMAIRFVEVSAFLRVISRQESPSPLTTFNRWFLAFFACSCCMELIRTGGIGAYTLGVAVDAFLVFFAWRAFLARPEDLRIFLKDALFVLIPFIALLFLESFTGRNMFAAMGGVPEVPLFRDGHYRAQGAFRSAITAGSIGAVFFSLFLGAAFERKSRPWAIVGCLVCLAIVVQARSSGPLLALLAGAGAWACWRIRSRLFLVRRGIIVFFICLNFVMKAPVWYIFDRVGGLFGGGGWHRANLIDQFVQHFFQWWLVGMAYADTGNWAATQLPSGGVDVTDEYVAIGLNGGLAALILFIALLKKCFSIVGRATAAERVTSNTAQEALIYGMGACLVTQAINIISVTYFDQSYVIFYLQLALIVSVSESVLVQRQNLSELDSRSAENQSGVYAGAASQYQTI